MYTDKKSKIKQVIEKHVQNSETFIGVLNDLVYSFVLRPLIGEMETVLAEEKEGLKMLGSDVIAKEIATTEIKKLETLINELKPLVASDNTIIKRIIKNRFMS